MWLNSPKLHVIIVYVKCGQVTCWSWNYNRETWSVTVNKMFPGLVQTANEWEAVVLMELCCGTGLLFVGFTTPDTELRSSHESKIPFTMATAGNISQIGVFCRVHRILLVRHIMRIREYPGMDMNSLVIIRTDSSGRNTVIIESFTDSTEQSNSLPSAQGGNTFLDTSRLCKRVTFIPTYTLNQLILTSTYALQVVTHLIQPAVYLTDREGIQ